MITHNFLALGTMMLFSCRINATSFKVIVETEEQVEVSFSRPWDPSLKGKLAPINIDLRLFSPYDAIFNDSNCSYNILV